MLMPAVGMQRVWHARTCLTCAARARAPARRRGAARGASAIHERRAPSRAYLDPKRQAGRQDANPHRRKSLSRRASDRSRDGLQIRYSPVQVRVPPPRMASRARGAVHLRGELLGPIRSRRSSRDLIAKWRDRALSETPALDRKKRAHARCGSLSVPWRSSAFSSRGALELVGRDRQA